MRILVTGGTGFLGSRLLSKLVADGHEVFALVRSDRSEPSGSWRRDSGDR